MVLFHYACSVVDQGGGEGRASPSQSNFFHYHAIFRKKMPNNTFTPLSLMGLTRPGNPGSATDVYEVVNTHLL